jgi:lipase maturation factor
MTRVLMFTNMGWKPATVIRWLFDSLHGASDRLLPRWIFLRALGLIYFSAFFSLIFQIKGLIGANGILPAGEYLHAIANSFSRAPYWYAPTLLWFSSSSQMVMAFCWVGLIAALLVALNVWPRAMLLICFVCFLSFVSAASEFSGYQSDGMLLEAGFISLFLAPPGFRPGLGSAHPPMRAAIFLLLWEWFRIYFESGVAKLASGDPEWRQFTAMDEYYQNGPLPTWIGWYAEHLPHWFHAATAFGTLALELAVVWMLFLPRRFRIICFFIVTPWQIGIILTANYTFLNYLVLLLGIFLLDDRFLPKFVPQRWRARLAQRPGPTPETESDAFASHSSLLVKQPVAAAAEKVEERTRLQAFAYHLNQLKIALTAVMFAWLFYSSITLMIWMLWREAPLPSSPVAALEPFRVAERYGLFAVMTRGRYEIEFQGSDDGQNWKVYPFRFKPQDPAKAPGIYAPYQPRFDWNLWFASLGSWRQNPMVPRTEQRLLQDDKDVLALFAGNPFPSKPPKQVRAVVWQYWFTTPEEKRNTGNWWRREFMGLYAPTLALAPDGKVIALDWPTELAPRE